MHFLGVALQIEQLHVVVVEDWSFHLLLPLTAYTLLVLSALAARSWMREALFGVGAAALLLLFIGIHNPWMPSCTMYLSGSGNDRVARWETFGLEVLTQTGRGLP
jgi:hypothetical protein